MVTVERNKNGREMMMLSVDENGGDAADRVRREQFQR